MGGTLYVVSTPIGNLEDITLRALRILREVDLIAAEDTRVTRKLLSHFDIHTPITSFHEYSRGEKADSLAARMEAGESVALVADAGTPLISDPGAELVTLAAAAGIPVIPVPGPSAVMGGLVASGLSVSRFAFDGFPPRKKSDRKEFFDALRGERRSIVLYESPNRLTRTLEELYGSLGDRAVSVSREITKKFEETFRGTLAGAVSHFHASKPRGEFVIVVAGAPARIAETPDSNSVESALRAAMDSGMTARDAIESVAQLLGIPRKVAYKASVRMSNEQ